MKRICYWHGAHSTHKLMYHIVWIPKYRKRVLTGALAQRLRELLHECAEVHEWNIEEINVQNDHVHMVVRLKPDISLSKAVQFFKGGSSKIIRKEFPQLEEFLWGGSLWADGYFAETVGSCTYETILNYVRNQ